MDQIPENSSTLDQAALEHALREVEPAVMLVPSWLLENVIAADREIGARFNISTGNAHAIGRQRLLQIVDEENLPLQGDPPADQAAIILLARPDNDWLTSTPPPKVFLAYWRLLFHASIDSQLHAKRSEGALNSARVQQRIEGLGRSTFREAAFVLVKDRIVPPAADDVEIYSEFAAAYLELFHFEPWMLHWYFPAADAERVLAVFAEDIDAKEVLIRTRLADASEPAQEPPGNPQDVDARSNATPSEVPVAKPEANKRRGQSLVRRALAAEEHGNDVRSALLRMRAASYMRSEAGKLRSAAARRIDALASRLRMALDLDESDFDPWRAVLRGLLARADTGWWNNERRLLYDLQKACVCNEREIYSANVVEWLLDHCRRPLRRPQPGQRLVTAHKALRSAERRAPKARLHSHDQAALRRLLQTAVERAENRLRTDLRPGILGALAKGDLHPHSAVEKVAEEKLVDELLDDIVRRGYLNLGNLRDAVSRNQLKLNDLGNPSELVRRDQLLRVDRNLEAALDGIYHRGEIYLRLFQRLSSVLFGTAAGRFITRVFLIPFVGAFILLEGLDHSVGILLHKLAHANIHFYSRPALIIAALFIMSLVNWPAFRAATAKGFRVVGRGLRVAFFDFPKWLGTLPLVRILFTSYVARLLFRYAIKPLAISIIVLPFLPASTVPGARAAVLAGVYLIVTLVLNSPAGREFEQNLLHTLRVTLPRFTWDILVGLFRLVMQAFDRLLESVDRALYAVDEWLRFGATQGRAAIVAKASLGVVWYYIAYVTRFVVNLLIEPQINPIKHFPVVTVSHKIMIPVTPALARGFEIAGLSNGTSWTFAGGIITGTPGVFGFLAWELKENYKLYRRNRPATLRPVRVGSHGENLAQLLRPGFHSGTVPKILARIRKSARRAQVHGQIATGPSPRDREAAHHVQHDVRAFIERELVSLINRHALWQQTPIEAGEVELAATRIRFQLRCEALGPDVAVISLDQREGYIVAEIEEAGWIANVATTQTELLRAALLGFYKLAAVDIVGEHLRTEFGTSDVYFDIRHRMLIVWTGEQFAHEICFDLADTTNTQNNRLLFREVKVPWTLWKRLWDAKTPTEITEVGKQIAPGVEVLPINRARKVDYSGPAVDELPAVVRAVPAALPSAS
jgi:cell division septation protein DedD